MRHTAFVEYALCRVADDAAAEAVEGHWVAFLRLLCGEGQRAGLDAVGADPLRLRVLGRRRRRPIGIHNVAVDIDVAVDLQRLCPCGCAQAKQQHEPYRELGSTSGDTHGRLLLCPGIMTRTYHYAATGHR